MKVRSGHGLTGYRVPRRKPCPAHKRQLLMVPKMRLNSLIPLRVGGQHTTQSNVILFFAFRANFPTAARTAGGPPRPEVAAIPVAAGPTPRRSPTASPHCRTRTHSTARSVTVTTTTRRPGGVHVSSIVDGRKKDIRFHNRG